MEIHLPAGDFKGYIFDCDGTLTDNMPLHYRAWSRAMRDFGGQFPEELFYSWGGRPTLVITEDLNKRYGLKMDPEEVVRHKEKYYLEMIPQVQPLKPVVEFVHRFHGKAKLAVASGGHRHLVESTLKALGILSLFDVIVAVEDYQRGKPDPEPFLLAAQRMGVAPADCLVFEDSPIGIQAAEAAGMQSVLVPTAQVALERLKSNSDKPRAGV